MELLQQMLQVGRLFEFMDELMQIRNEELQEKTAWEYYLHTYCMDMSFEEFMRRSQQPEEPEAIGNDRMVEIIKDSLEILARQ